MAYVPLIAPSTTIHRIRFLASIADTFIYVVSKASRFRVRVWHISNFETDGDYRIFRQGSLEYGPP